MILKFRENKGYTLGFSIAIIVVVATLGLALHTYTMSQIKTTKRTQNTVQNEYFIDGATHETIYNFIENLRVDVDDEENINVYSPYYKEFYDCTDCGGRCCNECREDCIAGANGLCNCSMEAGSGKACSNTCFVDKNGKKIIKIEIDNKKIVYRDTFNFSNELASNVDTRRYVLIDGSIENIPQEANDKREFLLKLNATVENSIDGMYTKPVEARVSISNIKKDILTGNITYDISQEVIK